MLRQEAMIADVGIGFFGHVSTITWAVNQPTKKHFKRVGVVKQEAMGIFAAKSAMNTPRSA